MKSKIVYFFGSFLFGLIQLIGQAEHRMDAKQASKLPEPDIAIITANVVGPFTDKANNNKYYEVHYQISNLGNTDIQLTDYNIGLYSQKWNANFRHEHAKNLYVGVITTSPTLLKPKTSQNFVLKCNLDLVALSKSIYINLVHKFLNESNLSNNEKLVLLNVKKL